MLRVIAVLLAASVALACASLARAADGKDEKPEKAERDAATILVRFADGVDGDRWVAEEGDEDVGRATNKVHVVKVKGGNVEAKLAKYAARGDVVYAEPNYIAYASGLTAPSDPSFSQQWGLPKIQALDAWALYPGGYGYTGTGPKIAIVDTGIQSNHPDLASQIDTADGANCVNSSSTCGSASGLDDNGHGTHVAGIAAAATNNGAGVAGTAFASQLIPVKVLNSSGSGTYAAITSGILWAKEHGARVISMSLGGASYSQTLCDAVTQAISAGILVVAAAGNNGTSSASYPAACPGTVGVAATDSNDGSPSWSNYGVPDVFVSAPGVSIYSTYPTSSYSTLSGTSMATPFVSALGAMLFGQVPSRTVVDVKRIVATTADKIGGVTYGSSDPYGTCGCSFHAWYGYGRINAYRALSVAGTPAPAPTPDYSLSVTPSSNTVAQGASATYTVAVNRTNGFGGEIVLSVTGLPSGAGYSFSPNPTTGNSSTLTVSAGTAAAGSYPFTISGTSGSLSRTTSATLVVQQPDFSLSASPSSLTVRRGGSTSTTVTVSRTGGFGDSVGLSVTGAPSGVTAVFSPNPATGASSTLQLRAASNTERNTYALTIKGTSGGVTRTTGVTLTVRRQ